MKKKLFTKDEIQTALDLHKEGASLREIANTLGRSTASVHYWVKKQKDDNTAQAATTKAQTEPINKLLLNMACGNDLSKWVGRSITSLQPREIYEFLKAINLQGELKSTQTIKI